METRRLTVPAAEEILGLYHPVHNKGYVSLKCYMGGDHAIEEMARTSYQRGTRKASDTRGLIRYLYRHHHTSPFEAVEFKFHMSMPIFVARQIVRTRTASLNEMSGRYSEMPEEWYAPTEVEVLGQDSVNKQGSNGDIGTVNRLEFIAEQESSALRDFDVYQKAIRLGVSREMARAVLPLSTMTNWYWKIDGNNLLKTLTQRCSSHAQPQTRAYFDVIAGMVKRVMPLAFEAWEDYTRYAATFSWQELEFLRGILRVQSDMVHTTNSSYGLQLIADTSLSERHEFYKKLLPAKVTDYDLDMSKFKTCEEMELFHGNSKRT